MMRKLALQLTLGFVLFSLPLSRTARADFIPISQPNSPYLLATTRLDFIQPDFSIVSSLMSGSETVTFDTDLVALTVPTTWTSWGVAPNTESSTPRVLWTNGFTSLTFNLSSAALIFGFEAEPNTSVPSLMTASFFSSGSLVGSITRVVDGNAGALLFAASTTTSPFDRIVMNAADDFAIANARFAAVPEPSTVSLCLIGLIVLLRARRSPGAGHQVISADSA